MASNGDILGAYLSQYQDDDADSSFNSVQSDAYGTPSPVRAPHNVDSPAALHAQATLFATTDNYVTSCNYLNQTLKMQQLPGPINVVDMTVHDKVMVVNVIYHILSERRSLMKQREETLHNMHLLQDANERLERRVAQLELDVKAAENGKWDMQRLRSKDNKANKATISKLSTELAAVKKRNRQILSRDSQYQHDRRRQEKEYDRLRDRLQKHIDMKSGKSASSRMDILNYVPPSKLGRYNKTTNRAEEELHQQTIDAYEERMAELNEENQALREALKRYNDELQKTLESHGGIYATITDDVQMKVKVDPEDMVEIENFLPDQQLDMPYEFVKEHIDKHFRTKLRVLQKKIKQVYTMKDELNDAKDSRAMRKLKEKCREYKRIITEQDRMLRTYLVASDNAGRGGDQDNRRWSGFAELEEERKLVDQQRRNQVKEAQQLEKERQRMRREKQRGKSPSAALPVTPAGIDLDNSLGDDHGDRGGNASPPSSPELSPVAPSSRPSGGGVRYTPSSTSTRRSKR